MHPKFLYYILLLLMLTIPCKGSQKTKNNKKEVQLVVDTKSMLGEGALWDYKNKRFLWIDIEGKKLHVFIPSNSQNKSYSMPSQVGTVVPIDKHRVLLALEDGIYSFNLIDSSLNIKATPEPGKTDNRFNDGKCDPSGRLWVGTMSLVNKRKAGALHCIDHNYSTIKKIDSVSISNGIVWSLDKTKMYYIDTPTQHVVEYNYDNESGDISDPKIIIEIPDFMGYPDGSTIDCGGNLWIALWGGSAVTCWDTTTGKLIQKIDIPAKNVTSCAFGGKKLDELYVTTAAIGMTKEEEKQYPYAGSLFKIKPGVTGVKAYYFLESTLK